MKWVSAGSSPSTEHTYMYTVSTQWQYKQYYDGDECVAWGVGAGQRRRGARYTVSQRYDTCFWLGFCQCFAIKGKTSRMSHSFLGFGRSHCHRTNSTLDMSDLIVCLCGLLRAMTWPEQIHHHNSKLHKNNRRKKKTQNHLFWWHFHVDRFCFICFHTSNNHHNKRGDTYHNSTHKNYL